MKTKLIAKHKGGKTLKTTDRASLGKAHNKREANIASAYFNAAPSLSNLLLGIYHWASSQPELLGAREDNLITGTAPVVGKSSGANFDKYVKALTQPGLFGEQLFDGTRKGLSLARKADTAARAAKAMEQIKKDSKPVLYVKEVFNIKTGEPYDGPLPVDWETMLPREGWAIRTVKK